MAELFVNARMFPDHALNTEVLRDPFPARFAEARAQ
jgi:hypothetical protein